MRFDLLRSQKMAPPRRRQAGFSLLAPQPVSMM
jgi:hypothetical protein